MRFSSEVAVPGTVTFIRHGEKESRGWGSGLTPRGMRDAEELGARVEPTVVVSSPVLRTVQTGEGISAGRVPVRKVDSLGGFPMRDQCSWEAIVMDNGWSAADAMWMRGEIPESIREHPRDTAHRIVSDVLSGCGDGDVVFAVTHNFIVSFIEAMMGGDPDMDVGYLEGITYQISEVSSIL